MARSRREARGHVDIWPGFVDALSTLLMAIIFLLVVFVLAQFIMSRLLQGQNQDLGRLQAEMRDVAARLQLEEDQAAELRRSLAQLTSDLAAVTGERDDLRAELAEAAADREQLSERLALAEDESRQLQRTLDALRLDEGQADQRLAALRDEIELARQTIRADRQTIETQLGQLVQLRRDIEALTKVRDELEADLAARTGELSAERDRAAALEARLAEETERTQLAQRELAQRDLRIEELLRSAAALEQARDAAQADAASVQQTAAELTRQIALLGEQLRRLDAALELKQQEIDTQSQTIADLGQRLNLALASKVEELAEFRSEFFGRMRRVLGDRQDIRIVGDRFVFQSEVLFASGTADLGPEGRARLTEFVRTLREIVDQLPPELPWVLQVDGHTDKRPINTPRFPSNWELSTARAISVAQFLVSQGLPPERVAATGFAEFQPIAAGDSEEAYRANRRIEIKLTTR
jgi:chemotaxis protein MotB